MNLGDVRGDKGGHSCRSREYSLVGMKNNALATHVGGRVAGALFLISGGLISGGFGQHDRTGSLQGFDRDEFDQ